tara:strand:- start:1782 stop:2273 length:492 start_codon:yes stop_codon:yes gene_type:complete
MVNKIDLAIGGILLGGVALAGFAGYRAVDSIFPGGDPGGGLLGGMGGGLLGGMGGGVTSSDYVNTTALAENNASEAGNSSQLAADAYELTGYYDRHPELEEAHNVYRRELAEYEAVLATYKPELIGFFGDQGQREIYQRVVIENQEAQLAYQDYNHIYQAVMA